MEKGKGKVVAGVVDLESSLLQIVQEQHQKALLDRDRVDAAKRAALRSATHVSELLVDAVNTDVRESFLNEKRIELEVQALQNTIMLYKKQTNQWFAASHSLNSVLKEIGDFENWMMVMDYDCRSINAALQNIYRHSE
ncbi:Biogenesis of lysosome-related organelles complex 1 subunit [Zostera marina]|uniref:Biogenesis of lysosome-related organelles complex 1 subunit 1 n=1 Tax=Zostera marina TaxID=29655 RepID=A0A0K9PX53_ZOSMR|nr:Biogenesis of lysosome-related organelles complex 1 subunit [Zostera marina]